MSRLVVAAVRRAGLSITPRLQMLARPTAPGLQAGLAPLYLPPAPPTPISINAWGVFLRLPLWPWHPH